MNSKTAKVLVVILAVVAVIEASMLLGLHKPYPAKGKASASDQTPEEFSLMPDAFAPPMASSQLFPGQLGHSDPFAEMERIRREMDAMVEQAKSQIQTSNSPSGSARVFTFSSGSDAISAIEVSDDGDYYRCTLNVLGANENGIKVTVEDDVLSVKGSRTSDQSHEHQGRLVARVQHTEHFSRSIRIPGPVDAAMLQTTYKDGVLTILLPKSPESGQATALP